MKKYDDKFMQTAKELVESGKSITEVAKTLNVDRHILSNKLRKINVVSTKLNKSHQLGGQYDDPKFLQKLYDEMIDLGMSLTQFKSYKHIDATRFSQKLKDVLGIYPETLCNRKKLNPFVFDNINEESSYWLGFLAADGSVSKDAKYVELTLKDLEHVEKFRDFLESDHKISKRTVKSNGAMTYRIIVGSTYLCNRLIELGIVNRKTYKELVIPDEITNNNLRHYIRGYFDGDGHIKRTSSNKLLLNCIEITAYDEESLNVIKTSIKNATDIDTHIRHYEGKPPKLLGNKENSTKLLKWMYENATIYLDRKYEIYNDLINCRPE